MSQKNSIPALKKMKIVTKTVHLKPALPTTTPAKTTCILNLPHFSFKVRAIPPTKKLPKLKLCNQKPQICTTESSNAPQVQILTLGRHAFKLLHAPNKSKIFQVMKGKKSLFCQNKWTRKKRVQPNMSPKRVVSRINNQNQLAVVKARNLSQKIVAKIWAAATVVSQNANLYLAGVWLQAANPETGVTI